MSTIRQNDVDLQFRDDLDSAYGFSQVPHWLFFLDPPLPLAVISVYAYLMMRQRDKDSCYPSVGQMQRDLGAKRAETIKGYIDALVERGLVSVERRGWGQHNRYTCLHTKPWTRKNREQETKATRAAGAGGERQQPNAPGQARTHDDPELIEARDRVRQHFQQTARRVLITNEIRFVSNLIEQYGRDSEHWRGKTLTQTADDMIEVINALKARGEMLTLFAIRDRMTPYREGTWPDGRPAKQRRPSAARQPGGPGFAGAEVIPGLPCDYCYRIPGVDHKTGQNGCPYTGTVALDGTGTRAADEQNAASGW